MHVVIILNLVSTFSIKFLVKIAPKNVYNFNVDNIRICKILGAGVSSSFIENGMVFKRGVEGEIKQAKDAKVAIFACPFDLSQTETKVLNLYFFYFFYFRGQF